MPSHALAQLEDVGSLVRLRPRFREITLEHERPRLDSGTRLVLEQPTVGEAVDDLRLEGDDQIRVEVRRVPHANGEGTAPAGSLRERDGRGGQPRGGAGTTELQEIATGEDGMGEYGLWLLWIGSVRIPGRALPTRRVASEPAAVSSPRVPCVEDPAHRGVAGRVFASFRPRRAREAADADQASRGHFPGEPFVRRVLRDLSDGAQSSGPAALPASPGHAIGQRADADPHREE